MNGGHGQVVQQHATMASKQEQEHVHMTQETLVRRFLSRKVASFKNAVMTLGLHGVHGIHVPIVEPVHLNNNARDENSFKFLPVHKKANQLKLNMGRRIVIIKAIGAPVSLNKNMLILSLL